ncbi:hypothetical protein KFL_001940230 [Klebsormidium nitens]|uniref:Uncharacterized protein n=1 Tax=Klebsormidium nitens TaxID=105231 RepID=A0A1Y1I767_KLENI|nr:hypothetical protein KFL_001940230 [Klebsormidium nitens]|eukprot:GAQ84566.1 hypothetical protein KFL_001940230 [Klebsormidium nitens]
MIGEGLPYIYIQTSGSKPSWAGINVSITLLAHLQLVVGEITSEGLRQLLVAQRFLYLRAGPMENETAELKRVEHELYNVQNMLDKKRGELRVWEMKLYYPPEPKDPEALGNYERLKAEFDLLLEGCGRLRQRQSDLALGTNGDEPLMPSRKFWKQLRRYLDIPIEKSEEDKENEAPLGKESNLRQRLLTVSTSSRSNH